MAGIINSINSGLGVRLPEPKNLKQASQKASWSALDCFKYMIYSALSCVAPQWATKKLSNLHAKYNPPLDPQFAIKEARKAVDKLISESEKLEEAEKRQQEAEERARVFPNRKAMLHGLLEEKIFEYLNIPKERAIDLLVRTDSLWPEGKPSITELSSHIYHNYPHGRDEFVRKCRAILSPLIWTKEIEERLEARTGNRRRREEQRLSRTLEKE